MVLSFASVFLLARGYSNSEIGVILAVSNVLALLIQPLAAELADRSVRISILHILWALCVLTAAFLIVASLVTVRSAALSVSYALAFALLIVIQPFMTSLSFHMISPAIKVEAREVSLIITMNSLPIAGRILRSA